MQIIDRRLNGKNKSAVNRQRFIRRYREQIRQAVSRTISERSISDIDSGEKINIPRRDIQEPSFHHGQGGVRETILPGNREFVSGDKLRRPEGGQGSGQGGQASDQGEGEDDFVFQLSREEFLEFFFDDLALPDMVKTQLAKVTENRRVRAGYTHQGIPTNINVIRSMQGALARRIAIGGPHRRKLNEAREQLAAVQADLSLSEEKREERIAALEAEIKHLEARLRAIPFIDDYDLRYNNRIEIPKPTARAVMFCIMDVSGSMDEQRKEIAKRFFILLYLFLTRHYEHIELVFIRHHTSATEVDEETFFHSRETGGTIVSSALKLMLEIVRERYDDSSWNIYAAQASDGDNWTDDSPLCGKLMTDEIMPLVQYFAYVEITPSEHQSLWHQYAQVGAIHGHFAQQSIAGVEDIYPVFRKLFKKEAA
ncbi:MAG: DUF444 family protein [Gammaproteobacteria bacterium]|nr:DUF444 family protein [Gammaproteobacteria bacterium]